MTAVSNMMSPRLRAIEVVVCALETTAKRNVNHVRPKRLDQKSRAITSLEKRVTQGSNPASANPTL